MLIKDRTLSCWLQHVYYKSAMITSDWHTSLEPISQWRPFCACPCWSPHAWPTSCICTTTARSLSGQAFWVILVMASLRVADSLWARTSGRPSMWLVTGPVACGPGLTATVPDTARLAIVVSELVKINLALLFMTGIGNHRICQEWVFWSRVGYFNHINLT